MSITDVLQTTTLNIVGIFDFENIAIARWLKSKHSMLIFGLVYLLGSSKSRWLHRRCSYNLKYVNTKSWNILKGLQNTSQKRTSYNKSVDIRQEICHQQADIRMRSHGLRDIFDVKSVASCQQTCCKLIVKTCYPQACCKLFQQFVTSLQVTNCNKPDFNRLVVT